MFRYRLARRRQPVWRGGGPAAAVTPRRPMCVFCPRGGHLGGPGQSTDRSQLIAEQSDARLPAPPGPSGARTMGPAVPPPHSSRGERGPTRRLHKPGMPRRPALGRGARTGAKGNLTALGRPVKRIIWKMFGPSRVLYGTHWNLLTPRGQPPRLFWPRFCRRWPGGRPP